MIDLSNENPDAEIFLFLAIMHSLTTVNDPQELKDNSKAYGIFVDYIKTKQDIYKNVEAFIEHDHDLNDGFSEFY